MKETPEMKFEHGQEKKHIIFVYKTNASPATDLRRLNELLKDNPGIDRWNFDFEDCDNIFRLVSKGITSDRVIELLASCNIKAEELID